MLHYKNLAHLKASAQSVSKKSSQGFSVKKKVNGLSIVVFILTFFTEKYCYEVGAVEAVMMAMATHPKSTSMCSNGCAALFTMVDVNCTININNILQ